MKKISKKKIICIVLLFAIVFMIAMEFIKTNYVSTNSDGVLSNKKIGWGIKRAENNQQPDLGSKNVELITEYNGIALGNNEKPYIYLTFDLGYEAGYTEQILDSLKETGVQATFFVTAHYVNSASDIVQRMINEGHIVGNHTPKFLMSGKNTETKCYCIKKEFMIL